MKVKHVAVIEWNWKGHHPTYFGGIVKALLDLGLQVTALVAAPMKEIERAITHLTDSEKQRLHIHEILPWAQAPKFAPGRLAPILQALQTFFRLKQVLKRCSKEVESAFDLIFFCCIYDWEFYHFPWFARLIPASWAGLYVQSFGFRKTTSPIYAFHRRWANPERFLRSKSMVAIGTLDEGIQSKLAKETDKGKCIVFPDFTDERALDLKQTSSTLAGKIQRVASEKKIISLCGMLIPQRGVQQFLMTAIENPQWCFVLVGELAYFKKQSPIFDLLKNFLLDLPNSLYYPLRVSDEREYNGIFQVSDVVWNIHIDYPGSSNTLTKAAVFEKPVIASNQHLIAERVTAYKLGEICDASNISDITNKLHTILDDPEEWRLQKEPDWKSYRSKHNKERLRECFSEIMSLLKTQS